MTGAFKVVIVMLVVPLAFAGLSQVFATPLALWGAVIVAGFLGISWFHRVGKRRLYVPYIIIWGLILGGMYYVSTSVYCESGGVAARVSSLLCPFPR